MGRLIFLGTGDPLNDERAQTGLALPLPGGETLLIDSSSGPILLRRLREANLPLEGIRHLFISHRHFDHAGGLAPLLVALVPLADASLTVYALPDTLRCLHDLLTITIPGVEDWIGARLRWRELALDCTVQAGGVAVTPFAVDHGLECAGFHLAQDGTAAVFTADTQPCEGVVRYARKADLLIHEVYSLDQDAKSAHLFGHSTAADAGRAARAAGARRLILTHFRSSRDATPAELCAEAAPAFGKPVELARDLDQVVFEGPKVRRSESLKVAGRRSQV